MLKKTLIFGFVIIVFVAFTLCFTNAGRFLVPKENKCLYHADAIIILMGNFPERVLQANDLYHSGSADRILIVEESMGPFRILEEKGVNIETNSEQAVKSLITLGVPADSIILLPGDARSTLDEAKALRNYMSDKWPADTLLLVSSPAHMRRASMIFRVAFSRSVSPVYIGCSPSRYSDFNPHKWWKRKEDIQSVLSEYVKIISFVLFEHKQLKQQP